MKTLAIATAVIHTTGISLRKKNLFHDSRYTAGEFLKEAGDLLLTTDNPHARLLAVLKRARQLNKAYTFKKGGGQLIGRLVRIKDHFVKDPALSLERQREIIRNILR